MWNIWSFYILYTRSSLGGDSMLRGNIQYFKGSKEGPFQRGFCLLFYLFVFFILGLVKMVDYWIWNSIFNLIPYWIYDFFKKIWVTLKPLNSGHHWFLKKVSAIERCQLKRGSIYKGLTITGDNWFLREVSTIERCPL